MPDPAQPLAVLFVDISESSKLYRALGDTQAAAVIASFLDRLARITRAADGQVVDRIGDELMATFPTAAAAVRAAVAMQWATVHQAPSDLPPGLQLAVRVGLHAGPATLTDGRPVGQVVYRAKRVVEHAKAHQILLDAETSGLLGESEWTLHPLGTAELKGQDRPADLVEVHWNAAHGTAINQTRPATEERCVGVALEVGAKQVQVAEHQRLSVGRLPPCDLVLDADVVSRTHAHIISRTQGVFLKDVSRNGCYVKQHGDGEPRFLHQAEAQLSGRGLIGLGRAPSLNAPHTIAYTCLTEETT